MPRQVFTPREYQQPVIDHILDVSRDAVWAGMGMGKTVSALTALDILEITEPGPAAAARAFGVTRGAIRAAILSGGTCCGYRWKKL